jgi:hypothetical protein
MSTTPGGSRATFVAIWCALVISFAMVAAGAYVSINHHGASLLCSAGILAYVISARALRTVFGAAGFATGSVRARALAGYVVSVVIAVGALGAYIVQYFVARTSVFWWDAALGALIFLGMLSGSILSYRYGIDYRKRDRPSEPEPSTETTKGADASHPRPSLHS